MVNKVVYNNWPLSHTFIQIIREQIEEQTVLIISYIIYQYYIRLMKSWHMQFLTTQTQDIFEQMHDT